MSSKTVACKYQKLSSKIAWQPKLVGMVVVYLFIGTTLAIFTIVKVMSLRKLSFFQSFVLSLYKSTFVECTINSCNIAKANACRLPKLFPFFFIIAENRPNIVFW